MTADDPRPTALGCHVYAGGFTLGVSQHFNVVAVFEDAGYGSSTHRLNFPNVPVHVGKPWPVDQYRGVEYIYTNPPCAIFSPAGRVANLSGDEKFRRDPRVSCWWDCFGLLEELRPRAWCLESVTQAYTTGRELVDELTKRALVLGYSVTHLLVNAAWLGVPQKRKRFFIVAHRPATLALPALNWAPPVTTDEALSEVDELGVMYPSTHAALVARTLPGEGLREAFERLNPAAERRADGTMVGRPSFLSHRLRADQPMGAFIGGHAYHPREARLLSSNEMKAMCRFPLDYQLDGPPGGWGGLLARGVMPPVAEYLARAVSRTLEQHDAAWTDRRVKLVDLREPSRQVVDLTAEYLDAAGRVRLRVRTDAPSRPVTVVQPSEVSVKPAARPEPIAVVVTDGDAPRALSGEKSGTFIKRLWRETHLSPDAIVAAVHVNYAGRTTKRGDVYFNYRKLLEAGENVRPWSPGRAQGARTRPALPKPVVAPAVITARQGAPRALVTGSTPTQVNSLRSNRLGIITGLGAWVAVLRELGYAVSWQEVLVGEDVNDYDVVVASVHPPNTIGSNCFFGALWALTQRPDAIVVVDDWQTAKIATDTRFFVNRKGRDGVFSVFSWSEKKAPPPYRDQLFEAMQRLGEERWPWPIVAPVIRGGDVSKLVLPGDVIGVNPTAFVRRYPVTSVAERARQWVKASLTKKVPPRSEWPLVEYGNVREGQPTLTEPELMSVYCQSWGVLSPPHPHAGSGWWRVRYLMAADAGCVLSAHPDEARVLGDSYVLASERARVERMSDAELRDLAAAQAADLDRVSASRDEVLSTWRTLIDEQLQRRRRVPR